MNWINAFELLCYAITMMFLWNVIRKRNREEILLFISAAIAGFALELLAVRVTDIYHYSPVSTYFVNGVEKPVAYRYMIQRARAGEDIELWGDPEAFKDVVYVKDLCQMMRKALTSEADGGIYHAGTGIKTTLRQQIQGMIDVFSPADHPSRIVYRPEKESFTSFVMDISNARAELGYEPQYDYISYLKDYRTEMELKRFDALWQNGKKE